MLYLTGQRETTHINNKVLKFWKYLYKQTQSPDEEVPVPNMYSDKDRADSLMAALIYQSTKLDDGDKEQYDAFLLKIMEEGGGSDETHESGGDIDSGGGGTGDMFQE